MQVLAGLRATMGRRSGPVRTGVVAVVVGLVPGDRLPFVSRDTGQAAKAAMTVAVLGEKHNR